MTTKEIIWLIVITVWWIGFLIFYTRIYRPSKDTWGAWFRNAIFSLTWPLTPLWMVLFDIVRKSKNK